MARNAVQFQKGLSEPAFEQQYGTEEQCRAVVIASRWPNGFECPVCGGRQHSLVASRDLYQCTKCRRQTSPIAGTIFASTHLSLRVWFRAIYHLTQTKQGISSIELGRRLGVTQTTASGSVKRFSCPGVPWHTARRLVRADRRRVEDRARLFSAHSGTTRSA
jgi:transposase-like protein